MTDARCACVTVVAETVTVPAFRTALDVTLGVSERRTHI
jgi:hypothetical protein